MSRKIEVYQQLLSEPLSVTARGLMVVAILVTPMIFQAPLWTMSFESNQYPDPLRLAIYVDHLEGQKTGMRDDLREINSLNHYIGMRPLLESDFSEFVWMPFVIGIFGLILLRAVVLGSVRDLVDVTALYLYFGGFSAWNFYRRLWDYGHVLAPEAPIKVEPFTPPFFGRVKIANFWIESFPGGGSWALGIVGVLLVIALVLAVRWASRARAEAQAAGEGTP
jgi:copper chaperone NosL